MENAHEKQNQTIHKQNTIWHPTHCLTINLRQKLMSFILCEFWILNAINL